jgi:hypothetical protein
LSLGQCVVAEAGCNWYLLDINIFPLSKKSSNNSHSFSKLDAGSLSGKNRKSNQGGKTIQMLRLPQSARKKPPSQGSQNCNHPQIYEEGVGGDLFSIYHNTAPRETPHYNHPQKHEGGLDGDPLSVYHQAIRPWTLVLKTAYNEMAHNFKIKLSDNKRLTIQHM